MNTLLDSKKLKSDKSMKRKACNKLLKSSKNGAKIYKEKSVIFVNNVNLISMFSAIKGS